MNDSLENNIYSIILFCFIYFIYYKGLNGRCENEKYLVAEIGNGGLANRINCLASSLLMSILCKRKLQSI